MAGAFQRGAFQSSAFQVDAGIWLRLPLPSRLVLSSPGGGSAAFALSSPSREVGLSAPGSDGPKVEGA